MLNDEHPQDTALATRRRAVDARPRRRSMRRSVRLSAMVNRRPKLELVAPGASAHEAAAIVAALERFMRETAPPRAPAPAKHNAWLRAARLEAITREPLGSSPWGDGHHWG